MYQKLKPTFKENVKTNCRKLKSVLLFMPALRDGGEEFWLSRMPNGLEH